MLIAKFATNFRDGFRCSIMLRFRQSECAAIVGRHDFGDGGALNLPNAFARHFKILPDFLKGVIGRFADSKPFP